MACRYASMFGEPGEGAHAYRVGGLAAVDVVATGLAAALLAWVGPGLGLGAWLLLFALLVVLGIAAHELACVDTALNRWLFGAPTPNLNTATTL